MMSRLFLMYKNGGGGGGMFKILEKLENIGFEG